MFCWQCGKKFQRAKDGTEIYEVIKNPLGHDLKVHKVCKSDAVKAAGPDREVKPTRGE
jgi:hypothetical protein